MHDVQLFISTFSSIITAWLISARVSSAVGTFNRSALIQRNANGRGIWYRMNSSAAI
ncbi:hypothetical protein LIPSTDRAFT_70046 [Lipomyces starkeyi NRRL Y-11557]|uniref:Uncharacterized protein n=1 Tax=Lipomyces starkeyi NRRL Y-11557 TaxID=675824 RepID=A0A1E3QA87_LIPST|nr:hypothetical protein LIPSTDRAFT_70046 [Lipomyces starkeyi NRRL Y-11557]